MSKVIECIRCQQVACIESDISMLENESYKARRDGWHDKADFIQWEIKDLIVDRDTWEARPCECMTQKELPLVIRE
jgi:hypothetical protein